MARPLRIEFQGAYYHLMNRGANRQRIFLEDWDYKRFLNLLNECRTMWHLETMTYCLMPNHYHLLARTKLANLSRIMRHIDGVYTQAFNKRHCRDGPLMRGRYKSILLDADSYLLQVSRYIHLNPVKTKLAAAPQDYPWSSYRFYLGAPHAPAALVKDQILGLFGKGNEAVHQLRIFTLAGINEEIEKFYQSQRPGPILGKQKFIEEIKNNLFPISKPIPGIPETRNLWPQPPLELIFRVVGQVYEVNVEEIRKSRRGIYNEARGALVYLARRSAGHLLGAIAQALGNISCSAIGQLVQITENRLRNNAGLRQRMDNMQQEIQNIMESEADRAIIYQ